MQNTSPWYRPAEDTSAHDIQLLVRASFYAAVLYITLLSLIGILEVIAGH